MSTPTLSQLQTTVNVLQNLRYRISDEESCAVTHFPDSPQGVRYLAEVQFRTSQHLRDVDCVIERMCEWLQEAGLSRSKC